MNKSIWTDQRIKEFPKLSCDIKCDVLVIGGGLAGILTAYNLKKEGKEVVLVEANRIGQGITSKTTAVITAQHDMLYKDLISMHGRKKAKAYLEANLEAVELYKDLSNRFDFDFELMSSYFYSSNDDLKDEKEALASLGFTAKLHDSVELPFAVKSAIEFENMAQMHPLKLLKALSQDLRIYEKTMVKMIKGHTALTNEYKINFKKAVVASHFPFIDRAGLFFVKMFQKRSYVYVIDGGINLSGTYTGDDGKGFYLRTYGPYLLIGKGDHRTGTKTKAFEELDTFVKKHYPNSRIICKWANQDCVTLDGMSYIGRYGWMKDVYTLTGFNLWGMTGSMVGARIITDTLMGRKNKYSFAFNPSRRILRLQLFKNLGTTIINMIKPYPKRCSHLGCSLKYNKMEHSYDCRCHGSRFDKEGKLLDGPATKDANI